MNDFQKKVDQIFGPTLYQYYNGPINSVIGSKLKKVEKENSKESVKQKDEDVRE